MAIFKFAIFRCAVLIALISLPFNCHALVIKDVISVNKVLDIGWRSFEFDLTKQGYNHLTDSIKLVELSYDFSKTIDEFDDYENYDTLETIQLNSYIFDGRSYFHDINPGVITQRLSWNKHEDYCEKENYNTGECEFNLDLNGTAQEFLAVYSGNIWLDDVIFSVEVDRAVVPEPSSLMLLALGLLSLCFVRNKSANKN